MEAEDEVAKGQYIGGAGTTGFSTGVHLHFAVRNAVGSFIEPLRYLAVAKDDSRPFKNTLADHQVRERSAVRRKRAVTPIARSRKLQAPQMVAKAGIDHSNSAKAHATKKAEQFVSPAQVAQLEDRFARAAQDAATFAKLYEEGAVSRVDRDRKLEAAKLAQAEFQALKKLN